MPYLYQKVEEGIKLQISQGRLFSGAKLPGEKVLMETYGVSRQTVRNAIASMKEKGILFTVQGKGTFVRDVTAVLNRQHIIGFGTISFKSYNLYPQILQEVSRFTEKAGYSMMLGQTRNTFETERSCLLNFLEKNVDAVILDPTHCGLANANEDIYRMFQEQNKPLIMYSARHINETASFVVADDVQGGYLAARHLLDLGHRVIGGIFQADDTRGYDRCQGMLKALCEDQVTIHTNLIDWYSSACIDHLEEADASTPNPELVRILRGCTALIVYNDIIAKYVLRVLDAMHLRCPEDISIVSFDDTELNSGSIGLTTIPYPGSRIGCCLGETVMELLNDPTRVIQKKVPVELIIRESTAKL